ncbi:hypothetical protein JB92DRAFT_2993126 [Gautieria morchelliformis]|nr:hypothetical protein JB92DRAFT_2993126 [Gautieria morchelliformis]
MIRCLALALASLACAAGAAVAAGTAAAEILWSLGGSDHYGELGGFVVVGEGFEMLMSTGQELFINGSLAPM